MVTRYYDDPVSAYAAEYSNLMESPMTKLSLVFVMCAGVYLLYDGTKGLIREYKDIKKNKENKKKES